MRPPLFALAALAALALLLAGAGSPALAEEDAPTALTVGDPAPPLDIAYWIKGVDMDRRGNFEPVTTFAADKIYVIEFWATWCGPCRMGMPHLSELQEEFSEKGVQVIGVSDESLPKVVSFLWQQDPDGKVQNDRTRYTLTTDPDRSTHAAYMDAANQMGIPTAFVVGKDGLVEWIGHPMKLDEVLEQVVGGTWDRAAFKQEFEAEQKLQAAMQEAQTRLMEAAQGGDWEGAIKVFEDLLLLAPENLGLKMQKLNILLTQIDDKARAYAYADEVAQAGWEDAQLLNAIAWTVVDDENVKHRDLAFAQKLADRANELTDSKDASILDTVARIHFEGGDFAQAVAVQTKAVEHASDDSMRAELEATLERYQAAAAK